MHVRRISMTKYPYPHPFKHGNYYPYPIRIRENYGYPQNIYPWIHIRVSLLPCTQGLQTYLHYPCAPRIMNGTIVQHFLYPAFQAELPNLALPHPD